MKKICLFLLVATFAAAPGWFANTLNAQATDTEKKESKEDQEEDQEEDQDKDQEEDLEEQMVEAIRAYRDDADEGLDQLRAIYKDHPDDMRIGMTLIQLLQAQASAVIEEDRAAGNPYFYESAKIARSFIDSGEEIPPVAMARLGSVIYNEACSYGVDGENEKAMAALEEAFELGFADFDLASEDSDFGDLLETDEFKKLIVDQREANKVRVAEREAKENAAFKESLAGELADFESFDFDFETQNMDGDDLALEDLQGKLVIVDFWGTWCPPCRDEVPSYVKLKKEFGDKIEIVGLAFERTDDDEEAYDNVIEFMEEFDINYECALGDADLRELVPDFRGYPTTLFIDGKGKVRFRKTGSMSHEKLEMIVKAIMGEEDEK